MITDSQVHLWEQDNPRRPWPQPPRGRPTREGGFSGEEAIVAMEAVGVDRLINVPAVVAGDDNSYAIEVAQKYPGKFGIMGRIDLGAPDSPDRLKTWRDQPYMLGIRLSGGSPAFRELLDAKQLEWLWSGCEEHRIPLMVLLGGQQEPIVEVAERQKIIIVQGRQLLQRHVGQGRRRRRHIDTRRRRHFRRCQSRRRRGRRSCRG